MHLYFAFTFYLNLLTILELKFEIIFNNDQGRHTGLILHINLPEDVNFLMKKILE